MKLHEFYLNEAKNFFFYYSVLEHSENITFFFSQQKWKGV